ncbi:hypothetical protein AK812_SmicGene36105 [Symbiodinium microadriaticum]|uniref:Uncharacterized protein n=1 Tax=Symbiodinium microadriaticum TaxID=2951 RepID=A0A1Q9CJR5_SYMMI|nr:hypothetical protein AK812_SmicGene36105 [Symbiodinium microadriaticum]CAE7197985.1 unnamed protein product [Symbiodinium microadriaticum]CAE7937900.1 unnamed protein product [Symbiodinium sp. KB8]
MVSHALWARKPTRPLTDLTESADGEVAAATPARATPASARGRTGPGRWSSLRPASRSMYESALHTQEPRLPGLMNLDSVVQCLHRDERRQALTSCSAHRPKVPLPKSPQHKKYCFELTGAPLPGPKAESEAAPGEPKHSVETLQAVFQRLAEPSSIPHRKFLAAIFTDKELSGVLQRFTAGLHLPEMKDETAHRRAVRKALVQKILKILKEADKDNSGSTEWDEFLEFFREAECLLEYQSEFAKGRNRSVLHDEVDAMRMRKAFTEGHASPKAKDTSKEDIHSRAAGIGRRASFRLAP